MDIDFNSLYTSGGVKMFAQGYWKREVINEFRTVTFPFKERDLFVQFPHTCLALFIIGLKFALKLFASSREEKNQTPRIFAESLMGIFCMSFSPLLSPFGYRICDLDVFILRPDQLANLSRSRRRCGRESWSPRKQVRSSANCEIFISVR